MNVKDLGGGIGELYGFLVWYALYSFSLKLNLYRQILRCFQHRYGQLILIKFPLLQDI